MSKDKYKQIVKIIIKKFFPGENDNFKIVKINKGIVNVKYKIIGANGKYIFFLFLDSSVFWKIKKERLIRKILNKEKNVVPIPKLLKSGIVKNNNRNLGFLLRSYVEGYDLDYILRKRKFRLSVYEIANLLFQLGRLLSRLHANSFATFGDIGGKNKKKKYHSWVAFFDYLFEEKINNFKNLPTDKKIGEYSVKDILVLIPDIKNYYRENRVFLSSVKKPFFCHNDTLFSNFIVNNIKDKWQIKSIIDMEWSIAGDPEIDLTYIENWLYFMPYSKKIIKHKNNFLDGYQREKEVSKEYYQKRLIYHLYRSLWYLGAVFAFDDKKFIKNRQNIYYVKKHYELIKKILKNKFFEICLLSSNT